MTVPNSTTQHHPTINVPTCSDADALRASGGLSAWVTSPRRTGGLFRGEIDTMSISGRPGREAL